MMRFATFLMPILLATSLSAQQLTQDTDSLGRLLQLAEIEMQAYYRLQEFTSIRLAASGFEDFPMSSDLFATSYRSPGRSFLYSLVLPGAGQYYTGSKTKAALFLGVEVASWVGYSVFHSDGKKRERDYESFADQYWSPQQYYNWLIETKGISDDNDKWRGDSIFTHHLPDRKTQQYYEMIGKYEQFHFGWLDTDYRRGDSTSSFRDQYLTDRAKANDAFNRAKVSVIVSLANRVLSAFDAALSARRYNRKQDSFSELSLKARMAKYEGERIPKLELTYRF